jgi:ribonuclease HII
MPAALAARIDDSKKLPRATREALYDPIRDHVEIGIGIADIAEIDRLNILQATLLAMRRAVAALPSAPAYALVDGNIPPVLPCPVRTVVTGDSLCLSIAAASIVAKVTRDRMMAALAAEHPGYGWERNAGYGTEEHRNALRLLGITPHHRRSFAPVAIYCK